MEAGAAERAARGQRQKRVTDWPLMGAAEYKHVVLRPIFLKYVEDAIDERRAVLRDELAADGITSDAAEELLESSDEYAAEGVFWVAPEARWQYPNQRAKQPEIGKLIDNAMALIEVENPSLCCTVPGSYARPSLDVRRIGELVDLISSTAGKDILGCIYEYFLGWCASAGAKGRDEFYTHQSVDKLLVEMLEPMNRRLYDGCCGSGGMVVQAERFVEVHGGQRRAAAHTGLKPSHLSQQLRVLRRAGLVHNNKTGTTVTCTLSHLLVVDLLTVTRSRLHEVINDRMDSLTELQTDFADQ